MQTTKADQVARLEALRKLQSEIIAKDIPSSFLCVEIDYNLTEERGLCLSIFLHGSQPQKTYGQPATSFSIYQFVSKDNSEKVFTESVKAINKSIQAFYDEK